MSIYLQIALKSAPKNEKKDTPTVVKKSVENLGKFWKIEITKDLAKYTSIDQLMKLADEIERADGIAYSNLAKVANAIKELRKRITEENARGWKQVSTGDHQQIPIPELLIYTEDGSKVKLESYFQEWKWHEKTFPKNLDINEMYDHLFREIGRSEEDFRSASGDIQDAYSKVQNLFRRKEGNLAVRSIEEDGSRLQLIQCEKDLTSHTSKNGIYVETSHITTLLIATSTSNTNDIRKEYKADTYVIPDSLQEVVTESNWTLYAVSLLKNNVEDYKIYCREKKWTVRDFKYDINCRERLNKEAIETVSSYLEKTVSCTNRLYDIYTHSADIWMHIRALRIFIEATLEYGHKDVFQTYLVSSDSQKNIEKIHQSLEAEFGDASKKKDEEATPVAADKEVRSYVSFIANLRQVSE